MRRRTLLLVLALAALACETAPGPLAQSSSLPVSDSPAFEVATIKPSRQNENDWTLGTKGNHFYAVNTSLLDLISFAYSLHAKQVIGGPQWVRSQRFDVEGVPDFASHPRREQLQTMLQKLLAQRFALVLRKEQRKLPVYILLVSPHGAKLTASKAAPPGLHPGYGFPSLSPVVRMKVIYMTTPAFVSALQRTVLDRPVLDKTGLTGRYDFTLKWASNASQYIQFRGIGVNPPAVNDTANAAPGLFTAIEEQLGLKLEAKRAMDEVMVIEYVEEPSAN